MKTTSLLTIASCLLFATVCPADERKEADRGLEGTLRSAINEKHVHIDVHKGIVTLNGDVRTEADRQRIESLVRNTTGVVAIKDKLHVTVPTPGTYGANPALIPANPGSVQVPVYSTPPPEVVPPVVTTTPAPVVIPEYPKLKVQAWTSNDQLAANAIARQLRANAVPMAGLENVSITVRNGAVSLRGFVVSREQRDAIIAAIQQAGGVSGIYDELQVR